MVEKSLSPNDNMQQLWGKLVKAFSYENATIPESDLFAQHAELGASKEEIAAALQWSKDRHFIEQADEGGRVRLTPQGRRNWREAKGES